MTNENNQNQNELAEQTVAFNPSPVVKETDGYVIKIEDGKFVRRAKYEEFSSVSAETREDKIWLLNLFDGDEESGNGLKDHVGKQIVVSDVITRPYDRINEETGEQEYGVLTYLITPEKQAFITSSKSVYFTVNHIKEVFGSSNDKGWDEVTVKVYKKKEQNGEAIKIKLIG